MVDWGGGVFASCCLLFISTFISAAVPLALASQLPLLMIVKGGWSGFPVRCTIYEPLALAAHRLCPIPNGPQLARKVKASKFIVGSDT